MLPVWKELWEHHRGKCIGVAGGLFFGLIYLISGFWDMLIVAALLAIGYEAGKRVDRGQRLPTWEDAARWLSERWGMFR
ncbi:DUF2273 domain-containing protein [Paenibacillus sp. y28]|uniref:DUF2273 domain-containing protein n=1 Tax=Paenibacillus sp. y28 TaxID=3129110 RepID=UPI00301B336D